MELDYLIVYLEILAICFIISMIMLFSANENLGSEWEVKTFKTMLIILQIALIMDAFTHAHYRHAIVLPRFWLGFLYSSYMFIFSGLFSYLWLFFAELRLGIPLKLFRRISIYAAIPVLLMGVFSYLSMKTGWTYLIDENLVYHRGPLWAVQNALPYLYFIITTIHCIIKASREPSPQKRRELYSLASFVISPFVGALLQLFIGSHPFVAPATTIALMFIFSNLQGNMINHDSLTNLNNRRATIEYIENITTRTTDSNPFYLYLLDVDKFKSINDTFGHVEGDFALKTVASGLLEAVDKYHGYVGRFGGDEFLVVIDEKNFAIPEKLTEEINNVLRKNCDDLHLEYTLSVTGGHVKCNNNLIKCQDLIEAADKSLYEHKKANI